MATCKDCVHFAPCWEYGNILDPLGGGVICDCFKNKADFQEVKHGEWLHKNGEMYCSICGSEALMDEVYYQSPYCPNCGAKMERKDDT